MVFDRIVGQERVKNLLQATLRSGRVPHAILLHGPSGVGKLATALSMAQALICKETPAGCGVCVDCRRTGALRHPDLSAIFPAPKNVQVDDERACLEQWATDPYTWSDPWPSATISIERIRAIRHEAGMRSFEGGARVTIIADSDRMRPEGANALLKILEEPPAKTYFVLISERPNALLPTIISRCQQVRLDPLPESVIARGLTSKRGVPEDRALTVSRLAGGSYRRAFELLDEDIQARKERAVHLLRQSLRSEFEQVEFVEHLLEHEDPGSLRDLLEFVSLWLRDAMVFQATGGDAMNLANDDSLETLQRFVQALPDTQYEMAIRCVEQAAAWMRRNVHQKLVMLVLLRRLRVCFGR